MLIKINVTCNDRYSILNKSLQIDPYLVQNGDLPRISDGFSEISIGSKGLSTITLHSPSGVWIY